MKEYLVLDGYNIINFWDDLKNLAREDLELARLKLIEYMSEYRAYKGIEVIIVFDAYMVKKNNGKEFVENGVKIVYTKENQTADSYIEKFMSDLPRNSIVRVATNDWAEQQIVLGKGGARLSARELRIDYENTTKKIRKKTSELKPKKNTIDSMLGEEIVLKLKKMVEDK